eukprot:TRINITY_DN12949_c0_g1_i1.p1 TRINITY_DN12949_c0_g1~~TRINITY_DN12949_c0_g1_i1.p1  ORF type:complete len:232 (+),score=33.15 TRINITY_DN12949_c0_g1_i1:36-698(+)
MSTTPGNPTQKQPITRSKMVFVHGARQAGKRVLMQAAAGREPIPDRFYWESEVFVRIKDMRIMLATHGGRERYRAVSHHQLRRSRAVVVVLDATAQESIEETSGILRQLLPLVNPQNIPIAVVANVKDPLRAFSEQDIKKMLEWEVLMTGVRCAYFQFSCLSVQEANCLVEWLYEIILQEEPPQETLPVAAQNALEEVSTSWSKKLYNWLSSKGVGASTK